MAVLPALVRTYSVRANAPFDNNTSALAMSQSLLFNLKQSMTDLLATGTLGGTRHANSVWTVLGSSDGTTAGLDAVDRWVTRANLIWAANGSPHSWILLQNTTLGYQVCIDCASASNASVGFAASETINPFSGGTTLTRPTAAAEICMGTTATGPTALFTFITDQATLNFNYTHYVTSNDGTFFYLTSRTGNTRFTSFMALQKTINNRVSDTRNIFVLGSSLNSTRGSPNMGAHATVGGCIGRNPNGLANTAGGIQRTDMFAASIYSGTSGVDALTGNYLAFPCHVASLGTQISYRGELPDFYSVGTATVGGSVPTAAAQERIIAGDFIIPFPTVVPNI